MERLTFKEKIEELEKLKNVINETDVVKDAMLRMLDAKGLRTIIFFDGTTTTDCGGTDYTHECVSIESWEDEGEYTEDDHENIVDFYYADKIESLIEQIDNGIHEYSQLLEEETDEE